MATITDERLRELTKAEAKLNALEASGVDNWDGYDFSMESIRAEEEREEFLSDICENIEGILGSGVYEPAGSGCGYGFTDKAGQALLDYLKMLQIVDSRKDKIRTK